MCQLGLDSTPVVFVVVVVVTECICSAERSPDVVKAAWITVHAVHGDSYLFADHVCFELRSRTKRKVLCSTHSDEGERVGLTDSEGGGRGCRKDDDITEGEKLEEGWSECSLLYMQVR